MQEAITLLCPSWRTLIIAYYAWGSSVSKSLGVHEADIRERVICCFLANTHWVQVREMACECTLQIRHLNLN